MFLTVTKLSDTKSVHSFGLSLYFYIERNENVSRSHSSFFSDRVQKIILWKGNNQEHLFRIYQAANVREQWAVTLKVS